MAHTRQPGSPANHNADLAMRTRNPIAHNRTITPVADEGTIAPSIDEFRRAGEAIRERWTEEQRRRIAENEATLRQLTELEPRVRDLSIQPHLPRSNDLTTQEQIAIIHGGATAAQYNATREMLSERHRQDLIEDTSPTSPVSSAHPGAPQNEPTAQTKAERTKSSKWDEFPDLNAQHQYPPVAGNFKPRNATLRILPKPPTDARSNGTENTSATLDTIHHPYPQHQNIDFLHTNTRLCTGPCPVQTPHNKGAYLQRGQVPRVWNARWGYSDPPREIWEAWVRIEQGRGRSWDKVEVDGFALSHWWAGP